MGRPRWRAREFLLAMSTRARSGARQSEASTGAADKRPRTAKGGRVLVVGSINVDLYQRVEAGRVCFDGRPVEVTPIKGQTLPALSFTQNAKIASQMSELKKGEEEVSLQYSRSRRISEPA